MSLRRVFVAYATADANIGAQVSAALRALDVEPVNDDGIMEPSAENIDTHLTNLIERCEAYVVLLSAATHSSSRLLDATNIAYLLWLQQRIRFFVPVVVTAMGTGDFARLLYRAELDPDGSNFRRRFTIIDGQTQHIAAIAEAIVATLSARANDSTLQSASAEQKRVGGTLPDQEVVPSEERERGITLGGASQPSPARVEPDDSAQVSNSVEDPFLDIFESRFGDHGPAEDSDPQRSVRRSRAPDAPPAPGAPPAPPAPAPMVAPSPQPSPVERAAQPVPPAGELLRKESQPTSITQFRDAAFGEAKVAETAADVTGTAYYPKEVAPREWENLLVYLALDTPQALAAVAADAAEQLVRRPDAFRPATAQGLTRLQRGVQLTIVPSIPGFQCNPPAITARWEEDVQRHEFRVRSTSVTPGQAVNGNVSIFASGILFADIPLSIFVRQSGGRSDVPGGFASYVARAYRKVFASYSHDDTDIVRMCRTAAEAMGDRYLMDVTLLRSGQQWNEALMAAIAEADLFQLFWSPSAAASAHVHNEWGYALQLLPTRNAFIRPVYWSAQPYRIPAELAAIHFERVELFKLGFAKSPPFWRSWFGHA